MRLRALLPSCCLAACALLSAPAARAGVTVALQPAALNVAPGALFDLEVTVTASGSAFNGFDAIVEFDPAALTLVQRVPLSLQEGALMTGACGNTFHDFVAAADSMRISDVLLCNGVSLTGPGQVYRLRFRASNTPQATQVRFRRTPRFYNGGLYVTPVVSSNALIGIGVTVGVEGQGAAPGRLRLTAAPNPARGGTLLRIEGPAAGEGRMTVFDALGRVVRRLEGLRLAGGASVAWDGRADDGGALPAGVYRVRVSAGDSVAEARVVLLR